MHHSGVTVIIPAYRSGHRLVATLESLAGQTVAPERVLLSFDAAQGYEPPRLPHVPGLEVVRQPTRMGWVAHTNWLIRSVRSAHFLLLYHDDTLSPAYLERGLEALAANPRAIVAHGACHYHGLRGDTVETPSIRGDRLARAREFLRRGPAAAELAQRGIIRSGMLGSRAHLRSRRSDGMFSNTLWSLEIVLHGESEAIAGESYDKYLDPDGLSRAYHGRSTEERSRMLAESVANCAAMLADSGIEDPHREELLHSWTSWVLGLEGHWNVLADEPSSARRGVGELRREIAAFAANVAASLVTRERPPCGQ